MSSYDNNSSQPKESISESKNNFQSDNSKKLSSEAIEFKSNEEEIEYDSEQEEDENSNGNNNKIMILKENSTIEKKKKKKKDKNKDKKEINRVKSLLQNDENDNDEEEKKNFRQIFDKFFSVGNRLNIFQIIVSILSLVNFIFYVVCTYVIKLFKYMNYFDIFVIIVYILEYIIHFTLAHHRFSFIFSLDSIIYLFTTIPSFFCFMTDEYMTSNLYKIINISRVFRFLRIFKVINFLKNNEENNVNKQITSIIITLLYLIFIVAGCIQIVEYTTIENQIAMTTDFVNLKGLKMRTNFHHYLYYTIVTLSTVGYGDIYPLTTIGKIIFMIFVLLIIIVIPFQLNDLIGLISSQSDYARYSYKTSKDIPHVMLTGDISLDSLKSFCQEFFHPDHGEQYRHAVILNNLIPSKEMEVFLHEKAYENFIYYLQGDPLNDKDLLRADAPRSKACIIFNNKNSKDPHSGDHQSLFLGIYIKKFVYNFNKDQVKNANNISEILSFTNPSFHLCMQLNKPESCYHFYNTIQPMYKKGMKNDQLIVIESIKMNLLSKSCLTPGIMALITNLMMSSGEINDSTDSEWMKEYSEGRGHEIYRIQLQNYYHQFTFLEVVENIYNQAQAIVFASEIEVGGTSIVKLNQTNSNNLTIRELIEKAKNMNNSDKTKESRSKNNNNSIVSIEQSNTSRDKMYQNTQKLVANLEKNIKIFVYLICSDKSVADGIANYDKEKPMKKILKTDEEKKEGQINNIISAIPNLVENLMGQKNSVKNNNDENKNENMKTRDSLPNNYSNYQQSNYNYNLQSEYNSDSEEESDFNTSFQFGSHDLDFNKNDYYINDSPDHYLRNNIEIMHHSIKDREDITNHIIICGLHPALVHFILPLRAKYLQEDALKWIVILAPSLPQHLFEAFTKFNRIIFIQGSPLLPENLFRANILNADKAVILSSGQSKATKAINLKQLHDKNYNFYSDEQMLDAETIFIYKAIKKCNKNIQIMTELICTNNIEYLLSTSNLQQLFYKNDNNSPQYEFTPIYASGEVFTPSIIDRITCQSYYNPHIITILDLLVSGEKSLQTKKAKKLDEFYNLGNSNLYLIKIPDAHVNESYGEFFYFLLRHHSIGIALYRKNIIDGFYYVYTNPKKTTLLRDADFVFVLSNNNDILDLVDERQIGNESESGFEDSKLEESDIDDEMPETNLNIKDKKKLFTGQDNSLIQARKKTLKKIENSNLRKHSINDYYLHMGRQKTSKQQDSSKNASIEKIQQRLDNIKNDLNNVKECFDGLPKYIDQIVEKELDSEMNVYLSKS